VRALALRHALSAKANAGAIVVIDALTLKEAKTSALQKSLGKLKLEKALFIAGAEVDANVARAARNIPHIDILPSAGLNVYDILRADKLVLTQDAVTAIHERFKNGEAKPAPKKRAPARKAAKAEEGAAA
jgi:large subunit ribosomal protein L4